MSKSKPSAKTTKIAYMIDSGYFKLPPPALDYLIDKLGLKDLDISAFPVRETKAPKVRREILKFLLQECYIPRHHPDLLVAVKKWKCEGVGIFATTEDRYVIMADRDYYEEKVYTPTTLRWVSVKNPRRLGIDSLEIVPKYLEWKGYGKDPQFDEQELSDFGDSGSYS